MAGNTSKGTKQSDFFFTGYFKPEHELTGINICENDDLSLRGVQFTAGIHNS
jgi:hypothetical protein